MQFGELFDRGNFPGLCTRRPLNTECLAALVFYAKRPKYKKTVLMKGAAIYKICVKQYLDLNLFDSV